MDRSIRHHSPLWSTTGGGRSYVSYVCSLRSPFPPRAVLCTTGATDARSPGTRTGLEMMATRTRRSPRLLTRGVYLLAGVAPVGRHLWPCRRRCCRRRCARRCVGLRSAMPSSTARRQHRQQQSPMPLCAGRAAHRPGTPRAPLSRNLPGLVSKSLSVASIIPPMTPEEHLTLSPWEKCTRFKRFPVKFVVQMALVATCTLQTLYYTNDVIPYFSDTDRMMHAAFFGFDGHRGRRIDADWSPPGNSGRWSVKILHTEDFRLSIQHLGQTFLEFPKDWIDRYDIPGGPAVIRGQIEWRSDVNTRKVRHDGRREPFRHRSAVSDRGLPRFDLGRFGCHYSWGFVWTLWD